MSNFVSPLLFCILALIAFVVVFCWCICSFLLLFASISDLYISSFSSRNFSSDASYSTGLHHDRVCDILNL